MKRFVLWPSYFDIRLTQKGGRRVPKKWAVYAPSVEEVATAAKTLGLDPEVDCSKAFPSTPWVRGQVVVSKVYSKQETIIKIGRSLKEKRSTQS